MILAVISFVAGSGIGETGKLRAELEARDRIIQTQAATIKARDVVIDDQTRRIRNLEGTVRDNLRTIEQLIGDRHQEQPSRGGARMMKVTAYTAGPESTGKAPGHPAYGITAAGHHLTDADAWRVAAADPEHYPAGTKIFVAGVGLVTILDTGAAVRGPDHIDIFVGMTAVREAKEWGVRRVPARIIGRVEL